MSTEKPSESVLDRQPHGRSKPLMTRAMLRNILGHAIYQVSVVFFFIWGLPQASGIPCGRPDCLPPQVDDCQIFDQACYCAQPPNVSVHYAMIFNVFVFMTLFNVSNMRILGSQRNVFRGIFDNAAFWLAVGSACVAQVLLIQFGGAAFNTTPISPLQWAICLIFALGSLLWHQVVLSLPLNGLSALKSMISRDNQSIQHLLLKSSIQAHTLASQQRRSTNVRPADSQRRQSMYRHPVTSLFRSVLSAQDEN
jgi:magnesium-transporting ATPase (P-type)